MSHQYDLHEQVKKVLSAKYFINSPDVNELESGDIIVRTNYKIVTNTANKVLEVTFQFRCQKNGIISKTILKMKAPSHLHQRVVDLITHINANTQISCFEFDYRDGEIASRNFLRCVDYIPSIATIHTMIGNTTSMFMKHGDQLIELIDVDNDALETFIDPDSSYNRIQKDVANSSLLAARPFKSGSQYDFDAALIAAKNGDSDAQYYVGIRYHTGKDNVPADPHQAKYWLEAAANAGNVDALLYLGLRILAEVMELRTFPEEKGFYGSASEGIRHLTLAAEKGNDDAQCHLANLYWEGEYIHQDIEQALAWYEKAAKQNNADAQFRLGFIYQSDDYSYGDAEMGAYWLERAAEQGNVMAQRQLASNYLIGKGVEESTEKFKYWTEKAALQGDETAIGILRQYLPNSAALAQIDGRTQPQPQPLAQSNSSSPSTSDNSGCCYIATCVYGSYDCPQVWTLRRFRDDFLAEHAFGRGFIRCYYAIAPYLVKIFGDCSPVRSFWKLLLDRMVGTLNKMGYQDTPYED